MYVHLLRGNRDLFVAALGGSSRAASGRPEAVADDEWGKDARHATARRRPVHRGAYRAVARRRRYRPERSAKTRAAGLAAIEEKMRQGAGVAILTRIYEAECLGSSYGFRPGRSQHDALDALA